MINENDPPLSQLPGTYSPSPAITSTAPSGPPGSMDNRVHEGKYGSFAPAVGNISPATPAPPDTQLAQDEKKAEETENRRARLSSNLLEQRHNLIENVGGLIVAVIVGLYLIFGATIVSIFMSPAAFNHELPVTSVVLIGMCGSIPTILSISLLVGLLAKDKESGKDEKSMLDSSLIAKACFEFVKYLKAPH